MKEINLDLDYLLKLSSLISKIRYCTKTSILQGGHAKAVIAGGAIRDMLFSKPISDIDVFYEGELNDSKLSQYFSSLDEVDTVYPDGWSVTHKINHIDFPVPIQLIKVNNIKTHLDTFPSQLMRIYFDYDGLHGLDCSVMQDTTKKIFFWDQQVDLQYFVKIKEKYSDWKHQFLEKSFNPEIQYETTNVGF